MIFKDIFLEDDALCKIWTKRLFLKWDKKEINQVPPDLMYF